MQKELIRIALRYLARFSTSKAKIGAFLTRKIQEKHGELPADWSSELSKCIAYLERLGYLNDQIYAQSRLRQYQYKGYSLRVIQQKLSLDGIEADLIDQLLSNKTDDSDRFDLSPDYLDLHQTEMLDDAEVAANYAKKRKLGKWRSPKPQALSDEDNLSFEAKQLKQKEFNRDLAILARRGFTLQTARKALGDYKDFLDYDEND